MSSIDRRGEFDRVYLSIADRISTLSYAKRRKVGCIIVSKDDQIISQGFNGTPSGMDNNCEYDWCDVIDERITDGICKVDNIKDNVHACVCCIHKVYKTKPYVLHAESNAISKCSKSCNSSDGATMYVTTSPCIECAKMIIQSGIKRVVYNESYSKMDGVALLESVGISVEQIQL